MKSSRASSPDKTGEANSFPESHVRLPWARQLPADTFLCSQSQSWLNNVVTTAFLCAHKLQETSVPQAHTPDGIIRLRQLTDLPNKNNPEIEVDWRNLCHVTKQSMESHLYWFTQQLSASCEGTNHLVWCTLKYFLNLLYGKHALRFHCWELLSCLSMKMMKAHTHAFMLSYSLYNYHWGWFLTLKQFWRSQGFQTAQNANAIFTFHKWKAWHPFK